MPSPDTHDTHNQTIRCDDPSLAEVPVTDSNWRAPSRRPNRGGRRSAPPPSRRSTLRTPLPSRAAVPSDARARPPRSTTADRAASAGRAARPTGQLPTAPRCCRTSGSERCAAREVRRPAMASQADEHATRAARRLLPRFRRRRQLAGRRDSRRGCRRRRRRGRRKARRCRRQSRRPRFELGRRLPRGGGGARGGAA